jgi:hypothetical protein
LTKRKRGPIYTYLCIFLDIGVRPICILGKRGTCRPHQRLVKLKPISGTTTRVGSSEVIEAQAIKLAFLQSKEAEVREANCGM